jgi:membrane protease YdiL (CAAX protease family)
LWQTRYICPARNKQRKNNHFDWMEELVKRQRPAWLSALSIFVVALTGFMVIGPLIGILIAIPFIEGNILGFLEQLTNPINHPEVKTPFYIIQGSATFFGLVVIPALYAIGIEKINLRELFTKRKLTLLTFVITTGIVIFFMGFNSVIIEWNSKIHLPDALKNFENWAREKEDLATEVTKFLTQFDSVGQFVVAIIVIGLFAGIGEELVFRGLLQPALHRLTKNIHVAIWISAILFSALHMQFFGFVPRVLLGALFGYLYYWSGNLAVPMFAHFVNNAFSVIAIYMLQKGVTDMDVESTEAMPLSVVLSFTLLTAVLLFFFRKQFTNRSPA